MTSAEESSSSNHSAPLLALLLLLPMRDMHSCLLPAQNPLRAGESVLLVTENVMTSAMLQPLSLASCSAVIPVTGSRTETFALPSMASREAQATNPFLAATSRAVNPSLLTWLTFKPSLRKDRIRISMAASFPTNALQINAVFPTNSNREIASSFHLFRRTVSSD